MASLLDLCEQYFGTRDFYEVLKIPKTANEKQVKKAYHQLSLMVHPDRVDERTKDEATEKFKVLGAVHSILGDPNKREIYDETGRYDENTSEGVNWPDYWRSLFKRISVKDIMIYEGSYKGSQAEIDDLKRAYMDSEGNMDSILESVPFTNCDEEPRLHAIIEDLIARGEVPEYKSFTEEDERKKQRRKRKWAKEAKEAEKLKKKLEREDENAATNDLALAINSRNEARADQVDNFFDSLIEKYTKKSKKKSKAKAQETETESPSAPKKSRK